MVTPPKGVKYNPNTGRLTFTGTENSAALMSPIAFSRNMPRGTRRQAQHASVPVGYTISTLNGSQFTYNGLPVFDNSPSTPLSVRTV